MFNIASSQMLLCTLQGLRVSLRGRGILEKAEAEGLEMGRRDYTIVHELIFCSLPSMFLSKRRHLNASLIFFSFEENLRLPSKTLIAQLRPISYTDNLNESLKKTKATKAQGSEPVAELKWIERYGESGICTTRLCN